MTKTESELLNRKLDFCLFPTRLDIRSIHAEFESFYSRIRNILLTSQSLILKQKLISLYSRHVASFHYSTNNNYRRPSESALTNDQKSALASLRNDPDLVIIRPDKGNRVCILNLCDYVSKMLTILNDQSKFKLFTVITIPVYPTSPNFNTHFIILNQKRQFETMFLRKLTLQLPPLLYSTGYLNFTNLVYLQGPSFPVLVRSTIRSTKQ